MCKVLIIPAIDNSKRRETEDFIMYMAGVMSKANSDGLGYAAVDYEGNLFGERWFVNAMAFNKPPSPITKEQFEARRTAARAITDKFDKMAKNRFWAEDYKDPVSLYNEFGDNADINRAAAITLHTRMATCEKALKNVHPFVDQDTSVIHNGVISNKEKFDLKLSTCDSESILISYLKNHVNVDPDGHIYEGGGVQAMADALEGYYATGVFSRDAEGNRILDVFKMNNNNLSMAFIYELNTYVIATSDHDIREACKALGFTHDGTIDLHDGYLTRINPFTGEVLKQVGFTKKEPARTTNSTNNYGHNGWNNGGTRDNHSNVLPHRGSNKKGAHGPALDAAMFKMMQLKSSVSEMTTREVEEYKLTTGLWD